MTYPYRSPNGYEERLNRQFMGHLHYSLNEGAVLLNRILEDAPVTMSDDASVVAHQYDSLPKEADTDIDRTLDLVVRDSETILGIESKYGDSLKRSQLRDELAKLRANAHNRDVSLLAITHNVSEPGIINRFENEPVFWSSWYSVAQQLSDCDREKIPAAQRVPLQMFQDLLEGEDMNPFTGFNHHDNQQYRYFIRILRPEANTLGLENRGDLHTWAEESPSPSGGSRIVPKYLGIPFVDSERPPHNKNGRPKSKRASVLLTVVDTEEHSVHAGVVFDINKIGAHRELLIEHNEEIATAYQQEGYELWIGRHSINNRSVPPEKTTDLSRMVEWLSEDGKRVLADPDEDNNYRKVWLLKECTESDPTAQVESVIEILERERDRLIEGDEYISTASLVNPETVSE